MHAYLDIGGFYWQSSNRENNNNNNNLNTTFRKDPSSTSAGSGSGSGVGGGKPAGKNVYFKVRGYTKCMFIHI